jgi:predicted phosphodiesterase
MTIKIVAISDTHCKFNNLVIPECSILISCGDYSFRGMPDEVRQFHEWLDKQPAKHIISVQGNHEKLVEKDFGLSKQIALEACPSCTFYR